MPSLMASYGLLEPDGPHPCQRPELPKGGLGSVFAANNPKVVLPLRCAGLVRPQIELEKAFHPLRERDEIAPRQELGLNFLGHGLFAFAAVECVPFQVTVHLI